MEAQDPRQPSEEELRAAFEEEIKRIKVQDVLLQTVATLVNLAARRLGLDAEPGGEPESIDLEQAQQAIEGARRLVPLLPDEHQQAVQPAISQLQMAFAREAQTGTSPVPGPPPSAPEGGAGTEHASEDERAKARAKLWTPPGA